MKRPDQSAPIYTAALAPNSPTPAGVSERHANDRGSITLLVVVFFIALLAATGLVVDGDTKLRAARQASAVAEEAARAGAGQIDRSRAYAHGGRFAIDRQAAANAARSYLTQSRTSGTVRVTGAQTITVTVTITQPTTMLSAIGIDHLQVRRTATADLVQGVTGPGQRPANESEPLAASRVVGPDDPNRDFTPFTQQSTGS